MSLTLLINALKNLAILMTNTMVCHVFVTYYHNTLNKVAIHRSVQNKILMIHKTNYSRFIKKASNAMLPGKKHTLFFAGKEQMRTVFPWAWKEKLLMESSFL